MGPTPPPLEPRQLAVSASVFYALTTLAGVVLVSLQSDLVVADVVFGRGDSVPFDALLGTGSGLALVAATWLGRGLGPIRRYREHMASLLGAPGTAVIAVLACTSAIGEEMLFRGALQPLLGLWPTVIAFGLLHGTSRATFRVGVAFATFAGALLGLLAESTGNLLAPMLCHATVNYFNLHLIAGTPPPEGAP